MPSSIDIANQEAVVPGDLEQELAAQMDAVLRMHRHKWWDTDEVDNRYDASVELRKAAPPDSTPPEPCAGAEELVP
ncbi:hypothetical protein GCM10023194_57300 [Planotetraspora phitsanulokensis]|uniref:Uncharacterized protein n=1 Tax=Planotetraspora phitsanulokensis TaxID=575192 RepID=A0A8J3UQX3_9ACTN|nr:hypothetical protein [Planotetraspora phitsanulokensis]GII43020.1 hypothetical protein Pph01_80230 [Planotetraspora phitsanulokensis]